MYRNRPLQGGKYPYIEVAGEVYQDSKYQRCAIHFYRNIFSVIPRNKMKTVARMLKKIHT